MSRYTIYKCEKYGYEFEDMTGAGRMAAENYNNIIKKMQDGELGDDPKSFFLENPEGIIDIGRQSMKCTGCGDYKSVEKMSMFGYIDDKAKQSCRRDVSKYIKKWPDIEDYTSEYIRSFFREYYVLKKTFEHKCVKCGGKMEPFNDFSNAVCPVCGGKLVEIEDGL